MNSRSHAGVAGALSALALLAVLACPRPAFAQGAPPPGDSVTAIARQRYNEGVAAYDAKRWEDARAAFLQAYALKHHPAVLLNLGQSELRSGHQDDAGNHLQQFLREHATATPDQRAAAEKGIAEAKKSAGFVVVNVDSPGADVSIDGTTIGKTPLLDPVFVKPGKHTVFAALQGRTAAASVDVKAGTASSASSLSLGGGGASAPAGPAPAWPPHARAPAAAGVAASPAHPQLRAGAHAAPQPGAPSARAPAWAAGARVPSPCTPGSPSASGTRTSPSPGSGPASP